MSKEQRTLIVPLVAPLKELEATLATIDAYLEACNLTSFFAHEAGEFNAVELQKQLYHWIREKLGLKAQMACSVFRQVAATYRHKDASKQVLKRLRGVFFHRRAMPLQNGRDWSLRSDGRFSINTLQGRVLVPGKLGKFQRQYLEQGWVPTAALLVHRKGALFLHVTVERDAPPAAEGTRTAGVDVGQNNLAAFSCGNTTQFWRGGRVKHQQRQYRHLFKSLQTKGTRGARRKLLRLSGKQKRWQAQVNHQVAKEIVELARRCSASTIAMENLKNVRENFRKTPQQRADLHGWAFYQLRTFVEYKAIAAGIAVEAVSPSYTSCCCSRCHSRSATQRVRHRFRCGDCQLELHADLNAARNIAAKARSKGHAPQNRAPVNEPLSTLDDACPLQRGIQQVEGCASLAL